MFEACGHTFQFWSGHGKSAHDAFAETEPDIYLGCTYSIDRATAKCIKARPKMKVALFASAWGPLVDNLDRGKYPIVIASKEEKERLEQLKAETGKPDFCFIHVTDKYLEGTMSGWRSIGIEPVGVLNAADLHIYHPGVFCPELACDASMCGSYWPYKARNIDRFIFPLLKSDSEIRVKIFGESPWPIPNYLGSISQEDERNLYTSSSVCLTVSEPHSTDCGFDTIERPYKTMACGSGVCIGDYVDETATAIFNNGEMIFARTPQEYKLAVRHFSTHQHERQQYAERAKAKIISSHSYHHRVEQMLTLLGLETEASKCRIKLKELVARVFPGINLPTI